MYTSLQGIYSLTNEEQLCNYMIQHLTKHLNIDLIRKLDSDVLNTNNYVDMSIHGPYRSPQRP